MTKIIVLKEKWNERFFGPYSTPEEVEAGCIRRLAERVADGHWYNEDDQDLAERIILGTAPKSWTAKRFLENRSSYEYEEIEIRDLTP